MHLRFPRGPAIAAAASLILASSASASTVYYVDNAGSDTNDGKTPAAPWKTLSRVAAATLVGGDTVLFKRGGQWRDYNLMPKSGQPGNPVTYGAYGSGNKPRLLGSVSLNSKDDWKETSFGSSIWVSQVAEPGTAPTNNQLGNPDFALPGTWTTSISGTMAAVTRSTTEYFPPELPKTDTASMQIDFKGVTGNEATSDIQVYTPVGALVAGRCYHFSFNAKATATVALKSEIKLFQNTSPYDSYATALHGALPVIGTVWAPYDVYFRATSTRSDGRLDFLLGKAASLGTKLYIDNVNFRECDIEKYLVADVGNVIFDAAQAKVGTKVMSEAALDQDGKFWYDAANHQLRLRWTGNPGHGELEVAVNRHIIDIRSTTDVTIQDLELRYTGGHGVAAVNTKRITLTGLDISYAGGSVKADNSRYGNGIEVFEAAQAITVSNNTFDQIFDVAMTAQGLASNTVADVSFTNNLMRRSEQCFELWNRDNGGATLSSTTRVTFSHNTCIGSGTGWGHAAHAKPDSADILLYPTRAPVQMTNIAITDNIFSHATTTLVRLVTPWNDYMQIDFSGNCYYPEPSASEGWLLKRTPGKDDSTSLLFLKSDSEFKNAFGTNTATALFIDPLLSADAVPAEPRCAGKGYTPPSS